MKVTWIVPDTYGFLVDELEVLSSDLKDIRVLTSSPITHQMRERLNGVELHYCPEETLWKTASSRKILRDLIGRHGWRRALFSGWHTRRIAGIYKKLSDLERIRPSDIIHSHFAHPAGLGGTLWNGPAQVLTLRGYDILTTGIYGSLWNRFYRTNLIGRFKQGHLVTAGSRFSLDRARQTLGSKAELRLLHQGVSLKTWQPACRHSRETLGLPPGSRVFLCVGNLVEVKNHELLVRVFSGLSAQCEGPLHLVICGDGPLRATLEDLCLSLKVAAQVHFMGKVPREELADLYALADLFIHTSMSEGFGNVIPEAFLHRLPVVASPVGIAPELVRHGENGFLPELGDLDSWIHYLILALQSLEKLAAGASETRQRVLEAFSMEQRIEGYLKVYREALNLREVHANR